MGHVRRILDEEIASVMAVRDVVESCHEAFRLYGLGEMVNPARTESLVRDGDMDVFRLELPGEWPGRFRGRKVIEERSDVRTGRLGARTAVIELEDMETGARAVLDAEWITNMRTGAAGALGARYLARQPVRTVAILGTGRIAQALALCADVALSPEVIRATSRKPENRDFFVAELGPKVQAHIEAAVDVAACVAGADAVLLAVPTPDPILFAQMIGEATHLSVIGGDARTRQLDAGLFLSRIVVPDHPEQVLKSGEFLAAKEAGREVLWARDGSGRVQTIGDAALNHLKYLRKGTGIAYFSGMAVQDIHAAGTAWRRLEPTS